MSIRFILIVLFAFIGNLGSFAKERILKTEEDGFQWYNNSENRYEGVQNIHGNTIEEDGWIFIGEVTLGCSHIRLCECQTKKAKLYVREIANTVVYRVELNGKFYAVRVCIDSNGSSKSYKTNIDGITYCIYNL